jgi:hypothetical protein
MNCFIDLVGVRECNVDAPTGGWINELAGISLESIDRLADSEQVTFKGVWSDVQREAARRFQSDFMTAVSECYELNAYCDYEEMACDNITKLLPAWRYLLGNQLMIERLYSPRLNFVTLSRDQASELKDYYQVQYENALKQASKLLLIDDCCLQCDGVIKTVTWLP